MKRLLLVWMLFQTLFCTALNLYVDELRVEATAADSVAARSIALHLGQDAEKLQRTLGVYPSYPLTLVVAADNAHYQELTGNQGIIEFSEAAYQFATGRMIIRNPRDIKHYSRLRSIVLHEYIHSLVHHLWRDAPLWFHEGMAVYFSGGLTPRRELNFMTNYAAGNYQPLSAMTRSYPQHQLEWESLYAYSALAVKYLYTKHSDKWFGFMERGGSGESFAASFQRSFYFTPSSFSHQFEAYAQSHFRMGAVFTASALLWALLPLILIIGVLRRRVRAKRILHNWQEQEENNSEGI
jgi:hypothetical protein